MTALEKKLDNQIRFWSLLGPFLLLASFAILVFKASDQWMFPVFGLVGIPLCLYYEKKGWIAAFGLLFFLSLFSYFSLEGLDRYWFVAFLFSMGTSFFVLSFSLSEVQKIIEKIELESKSRLDNFLHLDEKLRDAEEEWNLIELGYSSEIASLTSEIQELKNEKEKLSRLSLLSKEETEHAKQKLVCMHQEMDYKKHQILSLQDRLDESEQMIQKLIDTDFVKQNDLLNKEIKDLVEANTSLLGKLEGIENQLEKEIEKNDRLENALSLFKLEEANYLENKQECVSLKKEKESLLIKQKELSDELQHLSVVRENQKEALAELEKKMIDSKNKQLNLELDVENLKENLENKEKQISARDKTIGELRENYFHTEKNREEVLSILEKEQENLSYYKKDNEHLKQELSVKEKEVEKLIQEQEQSKEIEKEYLRLKKYEEMIPYRDGGIRKIEAMYLQLKEQFELKSSTLESTRKELFLLQETLAVRSKEWEESQLEETEFIAKLLAQYEFKEIKNKEEIEELSKIIKMNFEHSFEENFSPELASFV